MRLTWTPKSFEGEEEEPRTHQGDLETSEGQCGTRIKNLHNHSPARRLAQHPHHAHVIDRLSTMREAWRTITKAENLAGEEQWMPWNRGQQTFLLA